VLLLEAREDLGGVWRFTPDPDIATVMETTITSSSACVTEASDYPLPHVDWLGVDPTMGRWVRPRVRLLHSNGIHKLGPLHALVDLAGMASFRFNQAFKQVPAPMLPSPDGTGFIPDLSSRFWWDDIPHGLCVLYGLGQVIGLEMPQIGELIRRHQAWMDKEYLRGDALGADFHETNAPQRYGVTDTADLDRLLGW
jgi:hypothetical protein